jgi:VanZ family protein
LVPDPAAVVHLRRVPTLPWGDIGIHFMVFTTLTVLVHGTRWPKRIYWPVIVFLVVYGLTTESLQALVPPRKVELLDYTENILGVAAGTAIYWLAERLWRPRR